MTPHVRPLVGLLALSVHAPNGALVISMQQHMLAITLEYLQTRSDLAELLCPSVRMNECLYIAR